MGAEQSRPPHGSPSMLCRGRVSSVRRGAGHMADEGKGKWQIEGWGAAQGQIREAIEFLCKGKPASERAMIADELVALVRSTARGEYPKPQTSPFDRDEHERESWARSSAHHIVDG